MPIQTNFKHPKNETETHFLLKEISKYILFGWGYNKIGTEVHNMYSYDAREKNQDFKSTIDVVGIKKITPFIKGKGYRSKSKLI